MDGGQRALDPDGFAQFLQSHVRMITHQASKALLVPAGNLRLSPRETMPGGDIAGTLSLLQQFLDQAQRHVIAFRNLLPRPIAPVIRRHNPFPQICGYRSPDNLIAYRPRKGYSWTKRLRRSWLQEVCARGRGVRV